MARKPQKGQDAPLPFPLAGLDSSDPHDKQRPLTTRDGENVQSFDVLENRARGGSRPGLTKYVLDTVSGEAGHPVQNLNFLVVISDDAMLDDDSRFGGNSGGNIGGNIGGGTPGGPGLGGDGIGPATPPGPGGDVIPDGSTGRGRRRMPPGGRLIRPGGSGVRPTRNGKTRTTAPTAVNDVYGDLVGAPSATISVYSNDSFIGEPNFVLIAPVPGSINGSKIGTSGKGTGKRVTFLPPATGDGPYTFTIPYRLTAKGNRGSSTAVLTINVVNTSPPPPPGYPTTYYFTFNDRVQTEDGYVLVYGCSYTGIALSPNMLFTTDAAQPLPGPGWTKIVGSYPLPFPGVNVQMKIKVTGPNGDGFDGSVEIY